MTKSSFLKCKGKISEDIILSADKETLDNSRFLKNVMLYSHALYTYSNGKCNQPLHVMLTDILDKYSKSSDQCITIFNNFGVVY